MGTANYNVEISRLPLNNFEKYHLDKFSKENW